MDPRLVSLRERVVACQLCEISRVCMKRVFGAGNSHAPIFLLGEAPGQEEDKIGIPFVGPSGVALRKAVMAAGYEPDDIYLTNVIKCRPPANRVPEKVEIQNCSTYLLKQVEIVNPKVIVCLGQVAAKVVLGKAKSVGSLRGRTHVGFLGRRVVVTWHPAFWLRNQDDVTWRQLVKDLKLAREVVYGKETVDANEPKETETGPDGSDSVSVDPEEHDDD